MSTARCLDPGVIVFISLPLALSPPNTGQFPVYQLAMMAKSFISEGSYWKSVGTLDGPGAVVIDLTSPQELQWRILDVGAAHEANACDAAVEASQAQLLAYGRAMRLPDRRHAAGDLLARRGPGRLGPILTEPGLKESP